MTKQLTQKAVNTFIGGLITERGELTFPDNASVDELNCVLLRDGSRRRRLGMEVEATSSDPSSELNIVPGTITSVNYWYDVDGETALDYIVVQSNSTLTFYIHGTTTATINNRVKTSKNSTTNYTVDLSTFARPNSKGAGSAKIQTASFNGALIVVSPEINSFVITRDRTTGAFTETEIDFRIRDFEWQGDKSTYYESTASPSAGRQYDTENCGWVDTKGAAALASYQSANSNHHPPLNQPWYSGKDGTGSFSASEWAEVEGGTSLITNGHYIYDLYSITRTTTSTISSATDYTETERFTCATPFAGRIFYGGLNSVKHSNRVYFSQLNEEIEYIGDCFQVNDPTNEYFSDLLDTDGGFLVIPEAHDIKKLHVLGSSLLVFADNGVWAVSGVDDVFRATEYSVNRISNIGLGPIESFVAVGGTPFWWSKTGIHTITRSEVGQLVEEDLTVNTIQTFFNNIDPDKRNECVGGYDNIERRVYWGYPDNDETIPGKINNILILDVALGAFYPWRILDQEKSFTGNVIPVSTYILDIVDTENRGYGTEEELVVNSSGQLITKNDEVTEVVVDLTSETFNANATIKFVVYNLSGNYLNFATATSTDFKDWGVESYSSYAETGYDFMGDLTTKKTAVYLTVYLKRTETGFTEVTTGGFTPETYYTADRPSACDVSAYWDFRTNPASTQDAYRLKYPIIVDPDDLTTFDYPESVVQTRLKVRGKGRVMNLKFQSKTGEDFHLLGWEVVGSRNPRL